MKIKKIARISGYILGGIGSLFLVLLVLSLIPRKWQNNSSSKRCNTSICIIDNGFHTDILLPADNKNNNKKLDYKYLAYGWGDRSFFMKKPDRYNLQAQLIISLKALFIPTPTAMRVLKYDRLPKRRKCVKISQQDLLKLQAYIDSSFKLSENKARILLEKDDRYRSTFYAANGSYTALYTCNSWTAEALRKADLNTPVWGGFSFSIMLHLQSNCSEKLTTDNIVRTYHGKSLTTRSVDDRKDK